ncbi:MAG: hypothetical protein ACP5NZ_02355 [Nanobdellota archaeon]
MGFFSKRNRVVDYAEDYHYDERKAKKGLNEESLSTPVSTSSNQSQESSAGGFFGNFFGSSNFSSNSGSATAGDIGNIHQGNFDPETGRPLDSDEKRRRLAIRLKNMTDRIEDLSNQIYNLQQRIELLERRFRVNNSGSEE